MNTTTITNSTNQLTRFGDIEKGFLPVVCIPCAIICLLLYKYGKLKLKNNDSNAPKSDNKETLMNRMRYLNKVTGAVLIGHLIFGVLPNLEQPYPIAVGVALFAMYAIEECSDKFRQAEFFAMPSTSTELYYCVDEFDVEISDIIVQEHLDDPNIPIQNQDARREANELHKRRKLATLFTIVMHISVIIEGFILQNSQSFLLTNGVVVVIMFWISKLLQTASLCIAMIHAYFHGMENQRWPWYIIISISWCLTCGLSTIPAVVGFEGAGQVATHPLTIVIYSLVSGIILWIGIYFIWIQKREATVKQTLGALGLFGGTFLLSWLSSFLVYS